LQLRVACVQESLVFELVDAVVEVGEDREETVDEGVDDLVEELARIINGLFRCTYLGRTSVNAGASSRGTVTRNLLGVEAVHFDEAVPVPPPPAAW
jgi:hypothetical protein